MISEKRLDGFEDALRESDALRGLQRAAEARGLTFYVKPPRTVVPDFLGDHQPDAMARGPEGGVIIEVVHRENRMTGKRLAEIARLSRQNGWKFQAVYLNPRDGRAQPVPKPTWPQLRAAFGEIGALATGGHRAAALVSA